MDELIKAMSLEELEAFKTTYKANASIVALIDGYIATKRAELEAEAKQEAFSKAIEKLIAKLPHPEGIYNVYLAWKEVEEAHGEPEAVELVDKDGNKTTEMRQPTVKVSKWIVTLNKAFKVTGSGNQTTTTPSKRAITVSKRNPANGSQLVLVGHYKTGQAACDALKINPGVGSANKALRDNGYFVEPYEGSEFTS